MVDQRMCAMTIVTSHWIKEYVCVLIREAPPIIFPLIFILSSFLHFPCVTCVYFGKQVVFHLQSLSWFPIIGCILQIPIVCDNLIGLKQYKVSSHGQWQQYDEYQFHQFDGNLSSSNTKCIEFNSTTIDQNWPLYSGRNSWSWYIR